MCLQQRQTLCRRQFNLIIWLIRRIVKAHFSVAPRLAKE
uniref:Uncharacterized protein n=2 Tax=Klebsiella TaxID=570 RepID=A0A286NC98_KLEPN|nr:hypothetical protein [Klebsiella pneumoniae]AVX33811.1 Hypothetical protein [Klebsiella aerogenes]AWU78622.1 hypothetical protein [Klebsiella pneumoniae]QJS01108.1 hypothetical protein [Klebsiella pneumoniae]WCS70170.1 hypothetical protein [Klebsiella pneumoniae]